MDRKYGVSFRDEQYKTEEERNITNLQSEIRKYKRSTKDITELLTLSRMLLIGDDSLKIHFSNIREIENLKISTNKEQLLLNIEFINKSFVEAIEKIEDLYNDLKNNTDSSDLITSLNIDKKFKNVMSMYPQYVYTYFNTKARNSGRTTDLDKQTVTMMYNEIKNNRK